MHDAVYPLFLVGYDVLAVCREAALEEEIERRAAAIKTAVDNGEARDTAILNAGRTRLRPILMTTAAMVMGMVPLALGLGEGAEQRAPMAHAIIGGVITSTLLTLIVVPVVYTYLDDFKAFIFRLFGGRKS